MPKFAGNLSFIFQEVGFLDRFAAAAACGFKAVEYLSPYDHPAGVIAEQLNRHGLVQALFNMPPGDWGAGERGIGALPGREQEFRDGVETALVYAMPKQQGVASSMPWPGYCRPGKNEQGPDGSISPICATPPTGSPRKASPS